MISRAEVKMRHPEKKCRRNQHWLMRNVWKVHERFFKEKDDETSRIKHEEV
jgi:hypothetical protein